MSVHGGGSLTTKAGDAIEEKHLGYWTCTSEPPLHHSRETTAVMHRGSTCCRKRRTERGKSRGGKRAAKLSREEAHRDSRALPRYPSAPKASASHSPPPCTRACNKGRNRNIATAVNVVGPAVERATVNAVGQTVD